MKFNTMNVKLMLDSVVGTNDSNSPHMLCHVYKIVKIKLPK